MNNSEYLRAIDKLVKYRIPSSPYFTVSEGWQGIFDSRNNLSPETIKKFLNPESNLVIGICPQGKLAFELKSFKARKKIILRSNHRIIETTEIVNSEKIFGEITFDFEGKDFSQSNLVNIESFHELRKVIERFSHKKISILEIGSGYGELARQVIKFSGLDISTYHCVDLPNNLFFCELYLGTIFGQECMQKINFFSPNNFEGISKSPIKLSFFDPSEIQKLSKSYDLIINTYSMQEMNLDTTAAYMDCVKDKLKENGIFFSINSPKKWDIGKYSDYKYQNLKNIYSNMHREMPPSGPLATIPIVNVFELDGNDFNKVDIELMDTIGALQILGFGDFLSKSFCSGKLSITHPSDLLVKFLRDVISVRDNTSVFDNYSVSALVLGCCLKNHKILSESAENFIQLCVANNSLSDLAVLKLDSLTSNKIVHKKAIEILNFYSIKKRSRALTWLISNIKKYSPLYKAFKWLINNIKKISPI
jgi:putative sugar O-methyltransferase